MNNEWSFNINPFKVEWNNSFCIEEYHKYLLAIKEEYEGIFDTKNVSWCNSMDDDNLGENIFAIFQYDCLKHRTWTNHGFWKLFKDPREVSLEDCKSQLKSDCSFSRSFQKNSEKIMNGFKEHFGKVFQYGNIHTEEREEEVTIRASGSPSFSNIDEISDSDEVDDDDVLPWYLANRYTAYSSDDYDDYYQYDYQGYSSDDRHKDFTACDIECGYCGRCDY